LAIGLLTTGSVLYSTNNASAVTTPTFGTFSRALETPATLEIVPSPVIDTNGEFFFGTGDGSAGYYAERPISERNTGVASLAQLEASGTL
jgi:hypothetical protein